MGRSAVVGPALGGIIVLPLMMKGVSAAGLVDHELYFTRCSLYVAGWTGNSGGASGPSFGIDTGSTGTVASIGGTVLHMVTNEGKGEANIAVPSKGTVMRGKSTDEGTYEQERLLDSFPSVFPSGGHALFMQTNQGVGMATLECVCHVLLVPMSFLYDADNPSGSATNKDPIYFSSKD